LHNITYVRSTRRRFAQCRGFRRDSEIEEERCDNRVLKSLNPVSDRSTCTRVCTRDIGAQMAEDAILSSLSLREGVETTRESSGVHRSSQT